LVEVPVMLALLPVMGLPKPLVKTNVPVAGAFTLSKIFKDPGPHSLAGTATPTVVADSVAAAAKTAISSARGRVEDAGRRLDWSFSRLRLRKKIV